MNREIDPSALPTLGQLHRATVAAILATILLGVTTVLPAEWGLDPTGVGTVLGLTAMGELKTSEAPTTLAPQPYSEHDDETRMTLRVNEGAEIKADIRSGATLVYDWATVGGEVLYFDFHGEPEGAAPEVFTSFETGTRAAASGTFDAPFTGSHGWYWKNKTDAPVTVVLKTRGVYRDLGRR